MARRSIMMVRRSIFRFVLRKREAELGGDRRDRLHGQRQHQHRDHK
jgi:hypothetical protein